MLMPHSYASSDFLDVVLEALEGVEMTLMEYDAVAHNADLSVARGSCRPERSSLRPRLTPVILNT